MLVAQPETLDLEPPAVRAAARFHVSQIPVHFVGRHPQMPGRVVRRHVVAAGQRDRGPIDHFARPVLAGDVAGLRGGQTLDKALAQRVAGLQQLALRLAAGFGAALDLQPQSCGLVQGLKAAFQIGLFQQCCQRRPPGAHFVQRTLARQPPGGFDRVGQLELFDQSPPLFELRQDGMALGQVAGFEADDFARQRQQLAFELGQAPRLALRIGVRRLLQLREFSLELFHARRQPARMVR